MKLEAMKHQGKRSLTEKLQENFKRIFIFYYDGIIRIEQQLIIWFKGVFL